MEKTVYGIPKEKLEKILSEIVKTVEPEKVFLFGSRAKGTYRKGSDIDIGIEGGRELTHREERKLKERIEEISGIYMVDLIFLRKTEDGFKNLVEETGVILWRK